MIAESQEKEYFTLDADSLKEIFLTIVEANSKVVNNEVSDQISKVEAHFQETIKELE